MTQLVKLLQQVIVTEGAMGKARLSLATGKQQRMIERYSNGSSVPPSDTAYKLALACGCSNRDALKIAQDVPKKGRKSA